MNKYNKKINHLRQMLSAFGEYQNITTETGYPNMKRNKTESGTDDSKKSEKRKLKKIHRTISSPVISKFSKELDKQKKEDLQKVLGEIAGRKFPRFKRLTKEEKVEKEKLLNQTPLEKLHRDFHVYKIPSRILRIFIEYLIHLYRLWHVKHAKEKLEEEEGFNINDIKKIFDFSMNNNNSSMYDDDDDDDFDRGDGMKKKKKRQNTKKKRRVTTAEVFKELDNRGKWPLMKLYSSLDENRVSALAVILSVACLTFSGGDMEKMNQAPKSEIIKQFNITISAINVHEEGHVERAAAEKFNNNNNTSHNTTDEQVISRNYVFAKDETFDFIEYLDEYDVLINPIKTNKKKKKTTNKKGKKSNTDLTDGASSESGLSTSSKSGLRSRGGTSAAMSA